MNYKELFFNNYLIKIVFITKKIGLILKVLCIIWVIYQSFVHNMSRFCYISLSNLYCCLNYYFNWKMEVANFSIPTFLFLLSNLILSQMLTTIINEVRSTSIIHVLAPIISKEANFVYRQLWLKLAVRSSSFVIFQYENHYSTYFWWSFALSSTLLTL